MGEANDPVVPLRVAMVGNPNVGKTSLFNRMCGVRAKTANFPGSTVEARVGAAVVGGIELELVDTVFETSSTAATNFSIERGAFYETTMPEDIEAMWGPVPLDKLPDGKENRCNVVSHK